MISHRSTLTSVKTTVSSGNVYSYRLEKTCITLRTVRPETNVVVAVLLIFSGSTVPMWYMKPRVDSHGADIVGCLCLVTAKIRSRDLGVAT